MENVLKKISFIIFDLDGVFYKEEKPLAGTKEIINLLLKLNIEFCFFTNNSNYKIEEYQKKLLKCGVQVNKNKIFSTTKLMNKYLLNETVKDIYVLGSEQLKKNLYEKYPKNKDNPSHVILGMNRNIKLKDISKTINMIGDNTRIIATNPDKLIPVKKGYDLECGVIINIIENLTNKKVEILGKPSSYGFSTILKIFKKNKNETIMVGDTYETDILGAKNFGIEACWLETGNNLPQKRLKKDFIMFDSLIRLKESLEKVKR